MKNLLSLIVIGLLVISGHTFAADTPLKKQTQDYLKSTLPHHKKAPADIVVHTKGIVCSFCAQGIKKALKKHPAIRKIHFNKKFNKVELSLKRGSKISNREIERIVVEAGYLVEKIQRPRSKKNTIKK